MPKEKTSSICRAKIERSQTPGFRQRYDALEAQRAELLARLARLGDIPRKHSGFRTATKLLNSQFRRATLMQRATVLQSATWMINVLEQFAGIL